MLKSLNLRWRQELKPTDIIAVEQLTTNTGVFSPEEIKVAGELIECGIKHGNASGYSFLFAETHQEILGYTCFGPIPFTDKRFDLYWIAGNKNYHKLGIGKLLIAQTESISKAQGAYYLYAETSGRLDYQAARKFYEASGYQRNAVLSDYYRKGEDKIIYRKSLG